MCSVCMSRLTSKIRGGERREGRRCVVRVRDSGGAEGDDDVDGAAGWIRGVRGGSGCLDSSGVDGRRREEGCKERTDGCCTTGRA